MIYLWDILNISYSPISLYLMRRWKWKSQARLKNPKAPLRQTLAQTIQILRSRLLLWEPSMPHPSRLARHLLTLSRRAWKRQMPLIRARPRDGDPFARIVLTSSRYTYTSSYIPSILSSFGIIASYGQPLYSLAGGSGFSRSS